MLCCQKADVSNKKKEIHCYVHCQILLKKIICNLMMLLILVFFSRKTEIKISLKDLWLLLLLLAFWHRKEHTLYLVLSVSNKAAFLTKVKHAENWKVKYTHTNTHTLHLSLTHKYNYSHKKAQRGLNERKKESVFLKEI